MPTGHATLTYSQHVGLRACSLFQTSKVRGHATEPQVFACLSASPYIWALPGLRLVHVPLPTPCVPVLIPCASKQRGKEHLEPLLAEETTASCPTTKQSAQPPYSQAHLLLNVWLPALAIANTFALTAGARRQLPAAVVVQPKSDIKDRWQACPHQPPATAPESKAASPPVRSRTRNERLSACQVAHQQALRSSRER